MSLEAGFHAQPERKLREKSPGYKQLIALLLFKSFAVASLY
jgi:hypothetical protein